VRRFRAPKSAPLRVGVKISPTRLVRGGADPGLTFVVEARRKDLLDVEQWAEIRRMRFVEGLAIREIRSPHWSRSQGRAAGGALERAAAVSPAAGGV
jgi:hypothetical protein